MPLQFNVTWVNNFPANAQAAFNRALATWGAALNSTEDVDVTAIWAANIPGFNAICIPNAIENFANAPSRNTWYPSALADKIANQDLQAGDDDLAIFFAQGPTWNVGPGNPQANELDLESIALHELGHGLGMVGVFWVQDGWPSFGSYGSDSVINLAEQLIAVSGQQLPFPWPVMNSHPSVYALHIQDLAGNHLTNPGRYDSLSLGPTLVSNNLFFDLNRIPVYAPNPFRPFTSVDHLAAANSLMRPSIAAGQHIRVVDAPVLQILNELGWA
jgi:hypothetical protein